MSTWCSHSFTLSHACLCLSLSLLDFHFHWPLCSNLSFLGSLVPPVYFFFFFFLSWSQERGRNPSREWFLNFFLSLSFPTFTDQYVPFPPPDLSSYFFSFMFSLFSYLFIYFLCYFSFIIFPSHSLHVIFLISLIYIVIFFTLYVSFLISYYVHSRLLDYH